MSISLKLLHNNKHQFIANLYQQDACGWGRGGCRGQRSPPLKPAQVTLFTMILYNSENNIRDIRPFVWSQHCCEVCFISLIVGKSLWDLTTKNFWNRPPQPCWLDPPRSRLLGHYRPLSIGLPVLASRRLSSSVSSAIRFLFLDLTFFILKTALFHTYVYQTPSAFIVQNLSVSYTCRDNYLCAVKR